VPRAQEETGANPAQIARAYTAAREIFDMRKLWAQIEALDTRVAATVQYAMQFQTSRLLRHVTYWLLARRKSELQVDQAVAEFRKGVRQLEADIPHLLSGGEHQRFERTKKQCTEAGVPHELAGRIASLDAHNSALDIVELAASHSAQVLATARIYFELGARIGLDWLQEQVEQLPVEGPWQAVARAGLRDSALRIHRGLTEKILTVELAGTEAARVSAWLETAGPDLAHWQRMLADMRAAGAADFATLSVGIDSLRKLAD